MRYCILCNKYAVPGNGTFFNAPRDPSKRAEWALLCKREFNTCTRICIDHFSKDDVITTGGRYMLLPKAMPIFPQHEETPAFSSNAEFESPEMSLQDLGFFNYEQLTSTAFSKCPEPQFKGKESQTDPSIFDMVSKEYDKKIRQLEAENKDLRCQLLKGNLAIDAMKKIFTDGQIRSLMTPGNIKWTWNDISSAVMKIPIHMLTTYQKDS